MSQNHKLLQTMKIALYIASLALFVTVTACQTTAEQVFAHTLFTNGAIYTVDVDNNTAEALAIKNGEIVFVGSAKQSERWIGPNTKVADLAGGMILPGLIDAHLHPVRGGIKDLYHCNFAFTSTPQEIQSALAECVKNQSDAEWIIGGQWDSGWFERYKIDSPRALLDQVSGDKAVVLQDDSLHNVWVNSRALALTGFDEKTVDPEGGSIVRDSAGKPNGILLETAAKAMGKVQPPYNPQQQQTAVRKFVLDANSYGLTGAKSASTYPYELAALQAVDLAGDLNLHLATSMRTLDGKRSQPLNYDEIERSRDLYKAPNIDTRFVKLFLDGVPTPARTAAMLASYLPDDRHTEGFDGGELLIDPDILAMDLVELDKRGFTVKMHAAGDRSVRIGLDAIEAARKANGNSGLRHELAHAGYVSEQDIPRFKQLNAVADLSPILWHPSPIIDAIYSAVGKARGQHYFPVRDLIDADANLLAGSDWPAVSVNANPWPGIESLVTRQHPQAKVPGTLWPEQAITLQKAIRIYSFDGARALRKENITGSLETGKSADFIVLKNNLFEIPVEQISETLPTQTWFKGKLVYSR